MGADIFGFSGVEALIFDMDGVLAETIPAHIEAWHDFSRSMGHELTTKEIVDWMLFHAGYMKYTYPEHHLEGQIFCSR